MDPPVNFYADGACIRSLPSQGSFNSDRFGSRYKGNILNDSPTAMGPTKSLLVMEFDAHGNSRLREMNRVEILRMTRQAAEDVHIATDQEGNLVRKESMAYSTKSGFCDVQNVHMRDLRKLDASFTVSNEASVMVRKQAVLVNADPLRAVIIRHTCLVFVPDGADSLLSFLREKFKEPVDDGTPFEFRAIEAILSTLCRVLHTELDRISPDLSVALNRLEKSRMVSGELESVRALKNTVNGFDSQIKGMQRAIVELLENDEDLHLLHLTKLYENPDLVTRLDDFDAEAADVMLEVYMQDIQTIRSKVSLLQHRIQNTESLVMLKLDAQRNYLLSADVVFNLVSMCLTFGMFITGIFGMNLSSGLEKSVYWFTCVTVALSIISFTLIILGIWYFRYRGVLTW